MLINGTLLALKLDDKSYISDFVNVYNAGVLGRMGASVNIYDPTLQASLTAKVIAPIVADAPFYLQAPPNFFVLCIPLSFVTPQAAWCVYCSVGLALVAYSFGFLIWKYFEKPFARSFALVAALSAVPTWIGARLGNTSLYLLPPLVLFWWLLKQKKYFLAGLATGLLLVKVQYLPFIGLIGLATGGLRYLGGAVLAGLIVLGLTTLTVGWANVFEWPRILLHAEGTSAYVGVEAQAMQNLRGMIAAVNHFTDTSFGRTAASVMCVVSAFTLVWCWKVPFKKLQERSSYGFEISAGISTTVMLLFSIHTHLQDYILYLLACLWFYEAADKDQTVPEKSRKTIRKLAIAFSGVSWLLFFLSKIPILPLQPVATYVVIMLALVVLTWFKNAGAKATPGTMPPLQ